MLLWTRLSTVLALLACEDSETRFDIDIPDSVPALVTFQDASGVLIRNLSLRDKTAVCLPKDQYMVNVTAATRAMFTILQDGNIIVDTERKQKSFLTKRFSQTIYAEVGNGNNNAACLTIFAIDGAERVLIKKAFSDVSVDLPVGNYEVKLDQEYEMENNATMYVPYFTRFELGTRGFDANHIFGYATTPLTNLVIIPPTGPAKLYGFSLRHIPRNVGYILLRLWYLDHGQERYFWDVAPRELVITEGKQDSNVALEHFIGKINIDLTHDIGHGPLTMYVETVDELQTFEIKRPATARIQTWDPTKQNSDLTVEVTPLEVSSHENHSSTTPVWAIVVTSLLAVALAGVSFFLLRPRQPKGDSLLPRN